MRKVAGIVLAMLLILTQTSAAFAEQTLEEQIAALPDADEFPSMTREEQIDVYNRTQYAYAAYMDLPTAEEKAALQGAEEKFAGLFSQFNMMIMPIEQEKTDGKESSQQLVWVVLAGMAAILLGPQLRKKHT